VSEATLDGRINIGATLAQSGRMAIRHWSLCVIAAILMAGMFWLALDAAGLCTETGPAAWIGRMLIALPRGQGKALIGDLVTVLPIVVAYIAMVLMLRLFYLVEHPTPGQLESRQEVRFGRFARRTAIVWIIVASPVLLDCLYFHVGWLLYPKYVAPVILSIAYYGSKAVVVSLVAYLRSRFVLFIPATAYQEQPLSLRTSWEWTHSVRWRLFIVFWLIDLAFVFLQFGFNSFAPELVDFSSLAQVLADRSHLDARNVSSLLPAVIAYSALAPFAGLWTAGVSIVAYRKIVTIEYARASVFD